MKLKKAENVAKKLGISTDTFLAWREDGMPWVKIGKSIYILEDSFIAWARSLEIRQKLQDAPGQEFFGRSMGQVITPKNRPKSRGD